MAERKFIRRDSNRYSKIGKKRKKLQKWRKPKGRDNQMRLKRHGYPKNVSIGYKKPKKESGKIKGKIPVLVKNVAELNKVSKNKIIIVGKVGAKKKLEIIKKSKEMKIPLANIITTPEKDLNQKKTVEEKK